MTNANPKAPGFYFALKDSTGWYSSGFHVESVDDLIVLANATKQTLNPNSNFLTSSGGLAASAFLKECLAIAPEDLLSLPHHLYEAIIALVSVYLGQTNIQAVSDRGAEYLPFPLAKPQRGETAKFVDWSFNSTSKLVSFGVRRGASESAKG